MTGPVALAAYAIAVTNTGGTLAADWPEDVELLWPAIRELAAFIGTGLPVNGQTVQRCIDSALWAD